MQVDRSGRQAATFQVRSVPDNNSAIECQPGSLQYQAMNVSMANS
jgi:hypothetical protein